MLPWPINSSSLEIGTARDPACTHSHPVREASPLPFDLVSSRVSYVADCGRVIHCARDRPILEFDANSYDMERPSSSFNSQIDVINERKNLDITKKPIINYSVNVAVSPSPQTTTPNIESSDSP